MEFDRQSGIFLHLTSLPGPEGVGTLGEPARSFVDWLAAAGQGAWQFCPIGPTAPAFGNSPYSSFSAFGGNPLFVDLADLERRGWLPADDPVETPSFDAEHVEYGRVTAYKYDRLRRAHRQFQDHAGASARGSFADFRETHTDWLEDFALFRALKTRFEGRPWTDWPAPYRDRDPDALAVVREEMAAELSFRQFVQFCFERQWRALREYAAERDVTLVGDMPIYIGHDSADVWANREVFQLDDAGRPTAVAGVPASPGEPFGAQRWGSPLYDWDHLRETGFDWWIRRFERLFEQVGLVRIDHFRGLESYWSIPADEPDPNEGEWRAVPSREFFDALTDRFGDLPAFAEDIGHITESVDRLRRQYDLPSLRLLPFADWCADDHRYLPPYPEACVAYTSTHDSNTARGSYEEELNPEQRRCLVETLDLRATGAADEVPWAFLEAVWESDATLAMAQLQDVLELGSEARFNTPGEARGQWTWRVPGDALTEQRAKRLRTLTERTGR